MNINVKSSVGTGTASQIEVEPLETIEDVIAQVATIQSIGADSISLYKGDNVLPREKTLKNLGIKDGDTLHAIPRDPEGGALSSPHLSSLGERVFLNRIRFEAARIDKEGIPLRPVEPHLWEGRLPGRGRWKGQTFRIEIRLPRDYPIRPPRVYFLDQPRPPHPNISTAGVCFNHLQKDWSPMHNLVSVYEGLGWLLANPDYEHGFLPPSPEPRTLREWFRHLGA